MTSTLFVIDSLSKGGAQIQCKKLISQLISEDHNPLVFEYGTINLVLFGIRLRFCNYFFRAFFLGRIVLRSRPDIIIYFQSNSSIYAPLLWPLRQSSTRHIVFFRSDIASWLSRRLINKIIFASIRPFISFYLANSYKSVKYLVDQLNIKSSGFVPNIYEPCIQLRIHHNHRSKSALKLLCISRITRNKDPLYMASALSQLNTFGYQATVTWYGDIDTSDDGLLAFHETNMFLQNHGLTHKWLWRSFTSDIFEQLSEEYDCICMTSNYEGMSNVFCEGWLHGIPVFSSDVGDCSQLLGDLQSFYIFDKSNDHGLANLLIDFADDGFTRTHTHIKQVNETILTTYSAKSASSAMAHVLHKLANSKKVPSV